MEPRGESPGKTAPCHADPWRLLFFYPMKQLLAGGLCLLLTHPTSSQTIQDARNAATGSTVTVTGTVTSGPSLGAIRYLQDATAGIAAYPGSGSQPGFAPQPGDLITLTGTLTNYNGLLEITPISSFTVNSTGNPLPSPLVVTPDGVNGAVQGRLVKVEGVYFSATGTFTAGTWPVTAGTEVTDVYLRSGHPLVGTAIPQGPVDITGIASQYDPSAPYNSGFQLLPRGAADITPHASISIVPPVVQGDLLPASFRLSWSTNLPGSTEAYYGTTPALGAHTAGSGSNTAHDLQITGLQPATFYYVRPFSVASGDTAFAPVRIHSTASTSSGAIRVYFTKGVDTSVSSGEDAIGLFNAVDDTLIACINRAQATLDVAMYNTNSDALVFAVNNAVDRGVQVRWIAEGNTSNFSVQWLDPAVPVLFRENSEGSGMHNKFFVIDAEDPQRAMVMSGSCNWTTQSFFEDHNNIVLIQDQALARCYRMEFEEMWGGSGAQPVPALSRFGPEKTDNTPHLFNVGGVEVESFFSPTDGVTARIAQAIGQTDANLFLALYSFTENSLGDAVLAAHERPGVEVAGDVEDVYATGSEFDYLVDNGVDLFSHESEPGLLHHKYAILDQGTLTTDPRVATGSHNWTASAETVNDENTLIIHDARVANLFFQEWSARHSDVAAIGEEAPAEALAAWPIPADRLLHLRPSGLGPALITVHDATGREVYRMETNGLATIPTGDWPAGVYVVSAVQDGMRSQRTVAVVR